MDNIAFKFTPINIWRVSVDMRAEMPVNLRLKCFFMTSTKTGICRQIFSLTRQNQVSCRLVQAFSRNFLRTGEGQKTQRMPEAHCEVVYVARGA
jgi:hypothetical protein